MPKITNMAHFTFLIQDNKCKKCVCYRFRKIAGEMNKKNTYTYLER